MRIYVAGASAEAHMVSAYMRRLEDAGHTITLDWTKSVLANRAIGKTDAHLTRTERCVYAHADLKAVWDADAFWLILPSNNSVGCWVEYGYAMGLDGHRPTIVLSGHIDRSIFCELAPNRFDNHENALAFLLRVAPCPEHEYQIGDD